MIIHFRHILIILLSVFIAAGCTVWSDYEPEVLSELSISVVVSDTPGAPLTKSAGTKVQVNPEDYVNPAHNGEKMQTLRVVIVREDGTVEHNRLLDFAGRAYMEVGNIIFKVTGPEKKKIYLFVNENTVKTDLTSVAGTKKLVDFDLDSLIPGREFPFSQINDLKISLNDSSEEVPSYALPMSECHQIDMPAKDHHVDLYVTRAANKFTYIFDNQTSESYSISNLTINKGSNIEYYIPRISYEGDPLSGTFEVSDYVVPNVENNNYYSFIKNFTDRQITAESTVVLDPIYLLEGRYRDSDNAKNYSMSVTLNETVYEEYFPDVPQLPRNTHVVVVVTLKNHRVDWTVDVCPYGEYWLYPDFGI